MLELHELQVFLVAAETENFSETGRILQISQPAVSAHIQSLEQRLNTRLFDRVGRNIKLNEAGELLLPRARTLIKETKQIEDFMASQKGALLGQLTLGCSTASGKYILPRIMARFMEQHPTVNLICQVGPRGYALDQLAAGQVDLAVSSLRVPRHGVEYKYFSDDLLTLIAPPDHPWASVDSITPEQLVEHPLILREPASGTTTTLNRELAAHDMSVEMLQSGWCCGTRVDRTGRVRRHRPGVCVACIRRPVFEKRAGGRSACRGAAPDPTAVSWRAIGNPPD